MEFVGVIALLAILMAGVWWLDRQRRRRQAQDLALLLRRHPGMTPTARPMGHDASGLRQRLSCLPDGHRHNGIEFGVQGPLPLPEARVGLAEVDCAAFRWWWEQRRRQNNATRYVRRRVGVAVARLPRPVPAPISVVEESVLGRIGLTRAGRQLESSEFNRRFRVEGADDRLTLMLLDAELQHLLLEAYPGRSLELVGDLVVLVGTPSHRDDSLTGFIGELPALRADLRRLLAAFPPQFWRALGVDTTAASAPDPSPPHRDEGFRHG